MRRCDKLVDVGRRQFLRGAGIAAAGVAAVGMLPNEAKAAPGQALVNYPSNRLANISDLVADQPLDVGAHGDAGAGPHADAVLRHRRGTIAQAGRHRPGPGGAAPGGP